MRRRDFLRRSATTISAGLSVPYFICSPVMAAPGRLGANDRLRVGFIGAGGRARQLMISEGLQKHADIIAVADCFLPRIDEASKLVANSDKWNKYQDYRLMLEKEKLDAVFVPTTTHARALICIHAMQAGLDVYAEKPLTLTIAEGAVLIRAVRKYKRILQVGTQQRSMPCNIFASKLVREGAIGKIHTVMACNFFSSDKWEDKPAQPIPNGLNWDLWCNQTELRPYHDDLYTKWALWRDYDGGGQSWGITGWGTHALDQVQCALGTDDTTPVEVWPEEPGPKGRITMRYANGTLLKLHGPKRDLADLGAIFIGEKGQIEIVRGSFTADPPELLKGAPETSPSNVPGEVIPHINNFVDCVRSRKKPNADVETAHHATTICHLANICRDLGRRLRWDPMAEHFVDDDEANKLLSRPRRKGYELPQLTA